MGKFNLFEILGMQQQVAYNHPQTTKNMPSNLAMMNQNMSSGLVSPVNASRDGVPSSYTAI